MAKSTPGTDVATTEAPAPAVPQERPLNQTQLKNLEKIVEGDFADLRARVDYEIKQKYSRRVEEIEKEFGDQKKIDAAKKRVVETVAKLREQVQKLQDSLAEQGLTTGQGSPIISVSDTNLPYLQLAGKNEALAKAKRAYDRVHMTAMQVVNRRARGTQRLVLLQGISSTAAVDLINGLPNPEDIVAEVGIELSAVNEDDVQELHLN